MQLRDGGNDEAPLIGQYCGENRPPPIRSNGNQLYLAFTTDSSVSETGFEATFKVGE